MRSPRWLVEKARAVRQRRHAEVLGQRLAEVGEGRRVCRDPRPVAPSPRHQQRHVLARMVGARRRRIVAVIGGDDQQVVRRQGAAAVARSRRRSVRGWRRSRPTSLRWPYCVSKSTRLAKIRPLATSRSTALDHVVHALVVARGVDRLDVMPRPAKRSLILPIAIDGYPGRRQAIEQRLADRRQRVVVPIGGAREMPGAPTNGRAMTRPTPSPSTASS